MINDITLKNCLEFAVATEDTGAKFYARLAKKFADNKEVSQILTQLGKDEEVHKRQFAGLLKDLPDEPGAISAPEKREYVKAMSISEFFAHGHGPFADVDAMKSREDALEKAFGFEKATLAFYQAVRDILGENPTLVKVIETEKSHVVALMKVMITGAEFRSLQDKWQ